MVYLLQDIIDKEYLLFITENDRGLFITEWHPTSNFITFRLEPDLDPEVIDWFSDETNPDSVKADVIKQWPNELFMQNYPELLI